MPSRATPATTPPARTHQQAIELFRRPFAPGAIGFRVIPALGSPFPAICPGSRTSAAIARRRARLGRNRHDLPSQRHVVDHLVHSGGGERVHQSAIASEKLGEFTLSRNLLRASVEDIDGREYRPATLVVLGGTFKSRSGSASCWRPGCFERAWCRRSRSARGAT